MRVRIKIKFLIYFVQFQCLQKNYFFFKLRERLFYQNIHLKKIISNGTNLNFERLVERKIASLVPYLIQLIGSQVRSVLVQSERVCFFFECGGLYFTNVQWKVCTVLRLLTCLVDSQKVRINIDKILVQSGRAPGMPQEKSQGIPATPLSEYNLIY